MKALITGHLGFIGRHLTKRLKREGYDVIGMDMLQGADIRFADYPDVDVVFHLAGSAGVRLSVQEPEMYWQNNVEGSARLFKFYSERGIKVYYASSSSAKRWWLNPYATTKKAIEQLAPQSFCGMRFHTVYGFDSRPDMLYDRLLNKNVQYVTDHLRDFTHVDDIVEGILTLYKHNVAGIVDIGTGVPVSVVELAAAAGIAMSPTSGSVHEQEETCADPIELFDLGWRPTKFVLEEIENDIIRKAEMEKYPQHR